MFEILYGTDVKVKGSEGHWERCEGRTRDGPTSANGWRAAEKVATGSRSS